MAEPQLIATQGNVVAARNVCDRVPVEPHDWTDCLEDERGPGHEPDQAEAPEEPERDGVVVAGDAEVEVAEDRFVDEVEPEPAVDVSLRWQRDGEVAVRKGQVSGMALRRIGKRDGPSAIVVGEGPSPLPYLSGIKAPDPVER